MIGEATLEGRLRECAPCSIARRSLHNGLVAQHARRRPAIGPGQLRLLVLAQRLAPAGPTRFRVDVASCIVAPGRLSELSLLRATLARSVAGRNRTRRLAAGRSAFISCIVVACILVPDAAGVPRAFLRSRERLRRGRCLTRDRRRRRSFMMTSGGLWSSPGRCHLRFRPSLHPRRRRDARRRYLGSRCCSRCRGRTRSRRGMRCRRWMPRPARLPPSVLRRPRWRRSQRKTRDAMQRSVSTAP